MIDLDITLPIQIVNFLILMVVLNLLLYKPLMNILDARQKRIDDATGEARSLEEAIEKKVADYEQRLRAAKADAMEQRDGIKEEGTVVAKDVLGTARDEVSEMIQGFKTRAASEKEEARKDLRMHTEQIAREISEKILGRTLQ